MSKLSMGDIAVIAVVTGHGEAVYTFGLWCLVLVPVCLIAWGIGYVLWKLACAIPSALDSAQSGFDAIVNAGRKYIPLAFNRSMDAVGHILSL